MKITQIRNATMIIDVEDRLILLDPMLAPQFALPKLKYFKSQHRNPLIALPEAFYQRADAIEFGLITHCQKGHFDHLDRAGVRWLIDKKITVFCTPHDAHYLERKGIDIRVLHDRRSAFLSGTIEQIPATHTTGWLTPFMEHGTGYYIELVNQPSVYLMGDTVLTDEIRAFIKTAQPDYIVAPTGKAQFDIGPPLLLDEKEIVELASISTGTIIANHMDALDHCRITRSDLAELIAVHNLETRFIIPDDGETIELST